MTANTSTLLRRGRPPKVEEREDGRIIVEVKGVPHVFRQVGNALKAIQGPADEREYARGVVSRYLAG